MQKPSWLRARIPSGDKYRQIKKLLGGLSLSTVCEEARCPNIGECWEGGTATIMLMGDTCTRGCRFCNVKTGNPKGKLDELEPEKTSLVVRKLQLKYLVLTSVNRDDLEDEGASHFAKTIEHVKLASPGLLVEVLTPDFRGKTWLIDKVIKAEPHVFAHNIETVKRLTPRVRDRRASYQQSLDVLKYIKQTQPEIYTKSSIMLGLGETKEEIVETLQDLREVGCDVVTFGQYLRPAKRHLPVEEFVTPEQFQKWKYQAEAMGFLYCASGPLVRSSYKAGELFMASLIKGKKKNEFVRV